MLDSERKNTLSLAKISSAPKMARLVSRSFELWPTNSTRNLVPTHTSSVVAANERVQYGMYEDAVRACRFGVRCLAQAARS
jgi:hypothetical protein